MTKSMRTIIECGMRTIIECVMRIFIAATTTEYLFHESNNNVLFGFPLAVVALIWCCLPILEEEKELTNKEE
jgi:hypothetical protein